MNSNTINTLLSGKRYLLLQGPMGPFFNDMAEWLEAKRDVADIPIRHHPVFRRLPTTSSSG